jgi:hypothetical protein
MKYLQTRKCSDLLSKVTIVREMNYRVSGLEVGPEPNTVDWELKQLALGK